MPRYLHRERYHTDHRAEDIPTLASVLTAERPRAIVLLGMYRGGLAAMFADVAAEWGGEVHAFDVEGVFPPSLLMECDNLFFHRVASLHAHQMVFDIIESFHSVLYVDCKNKQRELMCYAPHLVMGSLIGVHDWQTEVDPAAAEGGLAPLGFERYRWEEFEALAHPPTYPISMSRFWKRTPNAA